MRLRPVVLASLTVLLCAAGVARVVADGEVDGSTRRAAHAGPASGSDQASTSGPGATAGSGERLIGAAPDHFDGAPAPGTAAACVARPGPPASAGTWAVIVGIDDYPGSDHDLRSSVNDAREVDTALSVLGVPSANRLALLNGEASSCGIRSALDWLVARASPEATAVFFFAGHARILGSGARAVMAADGSPITDGELGSGLSGLQARRAWIAMATCYGAGFTAVLGPGRVLTGAAGPNDLAYEALDSDLSYMVDYMVRRAIIGGGAPQSVEAAFAYAQDGLGRTAAARVPVQIDDAPGELDLRQSTAVPLPTGTGVVADPAPQPPSPSPRPTPPPAPPPVRVVPTTVACKPLLGLICIG